MQIAQPPSHSVSGLRSRAIARAKGVTHNTTQQDKSGTSHTPEPLGPDRAASDGEKPVNHEGPHCISCR